MHESLFHLYFEFIYLNNTTNQSRVFWHILVTKPTNNTHLNHIIFSQWKSIFPIQKNVVKGRWHAPLLGFSTKYVQPWGDWLIFHFPPLIGVVFLVWYFPTIHDKKMTYSFTCNSSPYKDNFMLLFYLGSMGTHPISHSTIGLGFFS